MDFPRTVVHPPGLDGSRRVTAGDRLLGIAYHLDDVVEILRQADVDLDAIEVEKTDIIEWVGGGPDDWPGLSEYREDGVPGR
ncbi:hypothetical protein OOK06_28370 [Streptomyces sp. NBC_00340]|uniref:hypothetical protein n=1 Tax=Streptomyces sp. NBC_00340 TaxID=2975716 RepID=UPI00224E8A99|nr:hypothetical protein [Streptomyces sp. NBC_00340]MCX5135987.1 hypothetical protein [Streptomyces sp. NBC_00340]